MVVGRERGGWGGGGGIASMEEQKGAMRVWEEHKVPNIQGAEVWEGLQAVDMFGHCVPKRLLPRLFLVQRTLSLSFVLT